MAVPQRKTDVGPPDFHQFLPPVIQKNYGKWKYHEVISPTTMVHVAESGDKIWTVRVASPRILATDTIREHCELAEAICVTQPGTTLSSLFQMKKILSLSRKTLRHAISRWVA